MDLCNREKLSEPPLVAAPGTMSDVTRNIETQAQSGIRLLPAAVAGLFFFAIWKASGMSLSLTADDFDKPKEALFNELENRAAGKAGIVEIFTWSIFALLGIYFHFINKERAVLAWRTAWPLLVLLVFIVLSIVWSSVPDIALRRVVKHMLLVAVLAGVVMGANSPRELLRLALMFTGIMMAMNIASVFLFPTVAFYGTGALQGLHGHKNNAGVFTMITIFVWITAARWSHGAWKKTALYLGTFVWFVFLLGTDSRTSIGSTILAIIVITPLRHLISKPGLAAACALSAIFLALSALYIMILSNISFVDIVDFLEGERETLTGRTETWRIVFRVFLDHLMLGTGYGSLWSTGEVTPAEIYGEMRLTGHTLGLTHAHNGYLDVMATLGAIGGALFLIFLWSVFAAIVRAFKSERLDDRGIALAEFCGFVFVATMVGNITKTTFLTLNIVWPSFLLCYLLLSSVRAAAILEDRSAASG